MAAKVFVEKQGGNSFGNSPLASKSSRIGIWDPERLVRGHCEIIRNADLARRENFNLADAVFLAVRDGTKFSGPTPPRDNCII